MKHYIFFFSLLAVSAVMPISAAKIAPDKALEIADDFLGRQMNMTRGGDGGSSLNILEDEIYVVNRSGGGWTLIAADDRVANPVLAYSPSGSFDHEMMPEAVSGVVGGYVQLSKAAEFERLSFPTRSTGTGKSVAPILGDIEWDQTHPFNDLFPEYAPGYKCAAGCVNIAIGQIMYHYRYPKQGRGQHPFTKNGQDYFMDFSQSIYQWDLMLPKYDGNQSPESEAAVAKLIYDCAIANNSSFGPSTGANLHGDALVNYFGYDKSIYMVERNRCSAEYYENVMREELDAGRPIEVGGGGVGGAHEFLCDGYDEEGYFHYNFGWGGTYNGYYLASATGFDSSPTLICSIMPDKGGEPGIWAGSGKDFAWSNNLILSCDLQGRVVCGVESNIEVAIVARPENGGESIYFVKKKYENAVFFNISNMVFNDEIEDGEYKLYPVYRLNGGEWREFPFTDNMRDYTLVSVENGVKTFTNPEFKGEADPGVETIDGYYYKLEGDEAIITRRNNRYDNYAGSITIPDYVSKDGREYPVVRIDEDTFAQSYLDTVTVGRNVRVIDNGAFSFTRMKKIIFAEPSGLKEIGPWAFTSGTTTPLDELVFPEGLEIIGTCGYRGNFLKLDLPSTLNYIGNWAFDSETTTDVYVHWTDSAALPQCEDEAFEIDNFEDVTLHVPQNCKEMYAAAEPWRRFGKIVEDSKASIDSTAVTEESSYITRQGNVLEFHNLPTGTRARIYDIEGREIGTCGSEETIELPNGLFIVRVGGISQKIII